MIRHIVLFKVRGADAAERRTASERLRAALEPLVGQVPGLVSLRVDADATDIPGHWDAALVSEHESWEALEAYQSHPAHVAVVEGVAAEVVVDRAAVDHEVER